MWYNIRREWKLFTFHSRMYLCSIQVIRCWGWRRNRSISTLEAPTKSGNSWDVSFLQTGCHYFLGRISEIVKSWKGGPETWKKNKGINLQMARIRNLNLISSKNIRWADLERTKCLAYTLFHLQVECCPKDSLNARHKYFRNKSSPYIKSMPDLFGLQGCKMENVQPSFFRLHSSWQFLVSGCHVVKVLMAPE